MTTAPHETGRTVADRVADVARQEEAEYSGGTPRPLRGYLATLGTYGGLCAALVGAARLTGATPPERVNAADLALITVATHKLSRILTKDPVTSPLRAPFTRYRGVTGPAELSEEVRETGSARHSVGELLTCPFCAAQWVATGFVFGLVTAPRFTRLAASVFTAVAGSDALQFAYARLEQAAE
ncbi:DUF1360 domain-containing protein [Pseudofrankia asymbiotica]|uniref:DUF1360 domain-containing protein n=1 Tax=Pseudofrankia asymbiotica TaxID=1834516 RepID=A0A1V2I8M8_9ACTN|nr:DUF1360 domain-containing protein [Pseudofrankia asymbiotica]ONH28651.1 hypothetical protein BL253_18880 [Pseudofrankia asymbiotica]